MHSEFYGTEIFLDNEATREYLDICRRALTRVDTGGYFEEHMVIPMDFWRFLPWAKKGNLNLAMPDEKKVYCKLTPEEHFSCHHLLISMFPLGSKQSSIAYSGLYRIREAHECKYTTAEEWGAAQRQRNQNKNWESMPEVMKYHPERFNEDGSYRGI